MFYLMTHSTHFILQLYGVRHMVKDHSDSRGGHIKIFLLKTIDALVFIWPN